MDWATLAKLGMAAASTYGKQQEGKAKGAVDQATVQQRQDQNALGLYGAAQNAQNQAAQTDLERQQFTQKSRGTNAKDAIIGALMGNFSPTGKLSSGLTKGMTTPEAKAAMMELNRQGLEAQFSDPKFSGGQMLTPPKMTPLPNVGGNGILDKLASLAQIAGAGYAEYDAGKKKTNPYEVDPE